MEVDARTCFAAEWLEHRYRMAAGRQSAVGPEFAKNIDEVNCIISNNVSNNFRILFSEEFLFFILFPNNGFGTAVIGEPLT